MTVYSNKMQVKKVKFVFKETIRAIKLPYTSFEKLPYTSFEELESTVRRLFHGINGGFSITYVDEDNDIVSIESDEDLQCLFDMTNLKLIIRENGTLNSVVIVPKEVDELISTGQNIKHEDITSSTALISTCPFRDAY